MKKILLLQIIAFLALNSFSQTQASAHLSFKGVPIDGTLNEFISKMKVNGFTLLNTENGTAILKGDFASYKDCMIGVSTLKQKDLVSSITVIFPDRDNWSSLSSNYFSLKEMLSEKYGKPFEFVEKFDSYEPDNDGSKMTAVKLDQCNYYTTYETDKGSIQLSIEGNVFETFVKLAYYDKINGEIIRVKALDDL